MIIAWHLRTPTDARIRLEEAQTITQRRPSKTKKQNIGAQIVIHLVVLGEASAGVVTRYESYRERFYARKYSFPLSDPNYVRNSQTITLMSLRMNSSLMEILYRLRRFDFG